MHDDASIDAMLYISIGIPTPNDDKELYQLTLIYDITGIIYVVIVDGDTIASANHDRVKLHGYHKSLSPAWCYMPLTNVNMYALVRYA
jgi:hypothetical protein